MTDEQRELIAAIAGLVKYLYQVDLTDDMVVAAMEHVPGCDHDDMVKAIEAALRVAGRYGLSFTMEPLP